MNKNDFLKVIKFYATPIFSKNRMLLSRVGTHRAIYELPFAILKICAFAPNCPTGL